MIFVGLARTLASNKAFGYITMGKTSASTQYDCSLQQTTTALLLLDSTLCLFPANGRPIILTHWITAMTTNQEPTRQGLFAAI
jgi:hypothetical protein